MIFYMTGAQKKQDKMVFLMPSTKLQGELVHHHHHLILISYRFSFQTLSDQILPTTPNVRSLLGFKLELVSLPKLRFLRVLCIEDSTLKDISSVIGGCIHLRLLRVRRCGRLTLPSSIGRLLYLQTIDIMGTELESVVPNSLWDIPTLRHVYFGKVFPLPPPTRSVRLQHKELQTFTFHRGQVGFPLVKNEAEFLTPPRFCHPIADHHFLCQDRRPPLPRARRTEGSVSLELHYTTTGYLPSPKTTPLPLVAERDGANPPRGLIAFFFLFRV